MSSKPNNQGPSMAAQRHIPRNRDSVGSLPHHLKSIRTRPAGRRDDAGDKQQFRPHQRLTTSFSSFTYNSPKCYGMNWKSSSEVGREGCALFYPKSSREETQQDSCRRTPPRRKPAVHHPLQATATVSLGKFTYALILRGFFKCQEKF